MKIFLSSTFLDLAPVRSEIAKWLTGVFSADLVLMETFGSDAAPPDITSVRRVRECEIFIGIYARRYGSVDPTSGKSITELEFDEARSALSSGAIRTILLYTLDSTATWPASLMESSPEAVSKLEYLLQKARQHTVTFFDRTEQLPFFVVRDVYREVGTMALSTRKLRVMVLPPRRTLTQPLGMEFLTSAEISYLAGREKHTTQLVQLLQDNEMSLLLGDSGVGKTSLIHAGLIPRVPLGWRAVYTRPLGWPESDIVSQLQASLFEGRPTYKGPIAPAVAEGVAALGGNTLLLIIDQFEDVLAARETREVDHLIEGLRKIRETRLSAVRVLISYRADLEGRLGELWQRVTGSPQGLPRLYLTGIDEDSALEIIEKTARDLGVSMDFSAENQRELRREILLASQAANFERVYPPYIQILIDHIWTTAKSAAGHYSISDYAGAGKIQGVVGTYLGRLLNYAQDSKGEVQAVLVTLVRSYGAKRQVTLPDVVSETGRDEVLCEAALEKLIDLRLVRHIGDYYEITHDFIARKVLFELVDSDELTFKRFRELLASKAAAFSTTRSLLTTEEMLMLYAYRDRVLPSDLELRLLLASWLNNKGPALFWLTKSEASQIGAWLQAEGDRPAERGSNVALGILLKRKLTSGETTTEDYSRLHGFQLAAELAGIIAESFANVPDSVLAYGLRHRRAEVRNAATQAIIAQISVGKWSWINRLRDSSSTAFRRTYEELVCDERVCIEKRGETEGSKVMREFTVLKDLASQQANDVRIKDTFRISRKLRLSRNGDLFCRALYLCRTSDIEALIAGVKRLSAPDCRAWLSGVRGEVPDKAFSMLLAKYEEWSAAETTTKPALSRKVHALARAICRLGNNRRATQITEVLNDTRLLWSSRPLVAAVLRYGGPQEIDSVLRKVGDAEHYVDYWNHTELGAIVEERMSKIGSGIPGSLRSIMGTAEFWEGIRGVERKQTNTADLLPIKNLRNRPLYIRVASYAAIGSAEKKDEQLLLRLALHPYGLIARSAARRLVAFFGNSIFAALTPMITDRISSGKANSISAALVQAELEYYQLMLHATSAARC